MTGTVLVQMTIAQIILATSFLSSSTILTIYAVWYFTTCSIFWNTGPPKPSRESTDRQPKVGIVIPVYNDWSIIPTLKSLSKINYKNFITVIIDDSTDNELRKRLRKEARILKRKHNMKILHCKRKSRRGYKAGALNDAVRILKRYDVKYALILDADFEPAENMLNILVSLAEEYEADIVQGYQKHTKGSDTVFGMVYRASTAGCIINLVGRQYSDLFPIFIGSCALIRIDKLESVRFVEDSVSEDWRWTIDSILKHGRLRIIVTHEAYANGSVPATQKSFIKQQIRWSWGTIHELRRTWRKILFSSRISRTMKLGYVLQGLFFTQGLWIYVNLVSAIILSLVWHIILFPWGAWIWLVGYETIITSGTVLENYKRRDTIVTVIVALAFAFYAGLIHAYGTLKELLGRPVVFEVTEKRQ
ncbi:MAG: glycosyltransferase [Crenarchaeota archaeon]|nr:glycosyltransferase [Thermoproteota archaeon]